MLDCEVKSETTLSALKVKFNEVIGTKIMKVFTIVDFINFLFHLSWLISYLPVVLS